MFCFITFFVLLRTALRRLLVSRSHVHIGANADQRPTLARSVFDIMAGQPFIDSINEVLSALVDQPLENRKVIGRDALDTSAFEKTTRERSSRFKIGTYRRKEVGDVQQHRLGRNRPATPARARHHGIHPEFNQPVIRIRNGTQLPEIAQILIRCAQRPTRRQRGERFRSPPHRQAQR